MCISCAYIHIQYTYHLSICLHMYREREREKIERSRFHNGIALCANAGSNQSLLSDFWRCPREGPLLPWPEHLGSAPTTLYTRTPPTGLGQRRPSWRRVYEYPLWNLPARRCSHARALRLFVLMLRALRFACVPSVRLWNWLFCDRYVVHIDSFDIPYDLHYVLPCEPRLDTE